MTTNDQLQLADQTKRLAGDLRRLGARAYNFMLPETQALADLIGPGEQIIGIVYGRYIMLGQDQAGHGALVATGNRILLVDKKPFFVKCDEMPYRAVSGVTYSRVGLIGTVTLHSKLGDIQVRTFNQKCARSFVRSVEAMVFEVEEEEGAHDYAAAKWNVQAYRN